MGNTPCCEASGAARPAKPSKPAYDSSSSDDDEEEEENFLSRTQTVRSGSHSIDKALQKPGTPTVVMTETKRGKKKEQGDKKQQAKHMNLVIPPASRAQDRRAASMRMAEKAARSDSDSTSSNSDDSDDSDGSSDDARHTPAKKDKQSSRHAQPLGAPRGKKTNSLLGSDDDREASRSRKGGQKKKKDKSKGKGRG